MLNNLRFYKPVDHFAYELGLLLNAFHPNPIYLLFNIIFMVGNLGAILQCSELIPISVF